MQLSLYFILFIFNWASMLISNHCVQVCKIVEGQRYSRRLNERQITALLKVTCQRPYEREHDIMQVRYWISFIGLHHNCYVSCMVYQSFHLVKFNVFVF